MHSGGGCQRRGLLAADWAAYAQDPVAQEVDYAFAAQADAAAEPRRSYRSRQPAGKVSAPPQKPPAKVRKNR